MNRTEENKDVVRVMTNRAKMQSEGTFEEVMCFQLGVLATMLADISKSLAMIADKGENKDI
jgi:hypothetical protein